MRLYIHINKKKYHFDVFIYCVGDWVVSVFGRSLDASFITSLTVFDKTSCPFFKYSWSCGSFLSVPTPLINCSAKFLKASPIWLTGVLVSCSGAGRAYKYLK